MRVSAILAENFKRWGITHVFGIPGKSISPVMLDVDSQEINFVLTRHESGAGFAAAGYSLAKNRKTPGVAIGTSGPGGTNMLTAAGQAKAFHLPVLFITGQPSAGESGKALGQDSSHFSTDLVKMFEPVTLFSARVERADLVPMYLRHAMEKAMTHVKGPVHLCIPFDVLMEDMEPFDVPLPAHVPHMVADKITNIIDLLDAAEKPVLFLGKGVNSADAYEEVKIVAEHWRIPVITTPGGKGVFPTDHPLALGNFGLGGTKQASDYLQSGVDLMVVIGTKLSDMSLSGFTEEMLPKQVIHFDYELTYVGKSLSVPTHAVPGDAKLNLRRIINLANASLRDYKRVSLPEPEPEESAPSEPLSAIQAVRTLRASLPHDAMVIGDDGSHTFYAIRHFDIYQPGTFHFDDVFGAMGHAIGYAVGAKIAAPDQTIVCLTGDGCVMMHGAEIATAVNQHAPVIFVVLNNGRLDMVDKGMSYNTGRTVGAIYDIPLDVAQYARSMGARAYCCHTVEDITEAVGNALQADRPTVIEIMVNPLEIPPILTRLLSLA
ncbi:thiamine pyrophosphate-binding protein [Aneurinibacillus terranovensis]|uniref:thiamine pyrophosphate-binding protein n=1 Tax=Aneurinibacillus terranovensis TaxID=278991 RepID=UPI0003FF367D|nr:thiamine pyrophosphate-binding protein [Aneurinibacillus terranovensis]